MLASQGRLGQGHMGLISTPGSKLNILDILHQPLRLRRGRLGLGAGCQVRSGCWEEAGREGDERWLCVP